MLSTPISSAAFHASRSASTDVACGWSCTPTSKRAMEGGYRSRASGLGVGERDAPAAPLEGDRGLAGEKPPDRLTDRLEPPSGREPAGAGREQRVQVGAG